MQNYKIPRTEILKLYESSLNEVSAHSIGQWLKSKTEDKYIVVPTKNIKIVLGASWDVSDAADRITNSMEELKENWL
jgi:hypothetical protein